MNGLFFDIKGSTAHHTTAKRLFAVRRFFKSNPIAEIPTGIWDRPFWSKEEYERWYLECLHAKINRSVEKKGRKFGDSYQSDLKCDARVINEWFGTRIRNSGHGFLRTKEMQERYPSINNPPREN